MSAKRCTGCGSMYIVKERITFCYNCGINLRDNIQATTKVCAQSSSCERGHSKWKFCATCGGERNTQTYLSAWNVVTATVPTTATTTPKPESKPRPRSEPERPGSPTSDNNHGAGVEDVADQQNSVEAKQLAGYSTNGKDGTAIREDSILSEQAPSSADGTKHGDTFPNDLHNIVLTRVGSISVKQRVYFSAKFDIQTADQIYISYTLRNGTSPVSKLMEPDDKSTSAGGLFYCVSLEFPRRLDADNVNEFTPVRLCTYRYYLRRGKNVIFEAPTVGGAKADSPWRKLELTKHEVDVCLMIERVDGFALPFDEKVPINKMLRIPRLQNELEAVFEADLPQLSIGSWETQSDKLEYLDLNAVGLVRMVSQYLPSFTAANTLQQCVSLLAAHLNTHINLLLRESKSKLTCSIILLQALVSMNSEKMKLRDIFVAMAKNRSLEALCKCLLGVSSEWITEFQSQFKQGQSSPEFYEIWQPMGDVGEITTDLDWIRRCVKEAMLALAEVPQPAKENSGPIFAVSLVLLWHAIADNFVPGDVPKPKAQNPVPPFDLEWCGLSIFEKSIEPLRTAFLQVDDNALKEMYNMLCGPIQIVPITSRAFAHLLSVGQLAQIADLEFDQVSIDAIINAVLHHFKGKRFVSKVDGELLIQTLQKLCSRTMSLPTDLSKLGESFTKVVVKSNMVRDSAVIGLRLLTEMQQDYFKDLKESDQGWKAAMFQDNHFESFLLCAEFILKLTHVLLNFIKTAPETMANELGFANVRCSKVKLEAEKLICETLRSMLGAFFIDAYVRIKQSFDDVDRRPIGLFSSMFMVAENIKDIELKEELSVTFKGVFENEKLNYEDCMAVYAILTSSKNLRWFSNSDLAMKSFPENLLEAVENHMVTTVLVKAFGSLNIGRFKFLNDSPLLSKYVTSKLDYKTEMEQIEAVLTQTAVSCIFKQNRMSILDIISVNFYCGVKKLIVESIGIQQLSNGEIKLAALELIGRSRESYLSLMLSLDQSQFYICEPKVEDLLTMRIEEFGLYRDFKQKIQTFCLFYDNLKNDLLRTWTSKSSANDSDLQLSEVIQPRRKSDEDCKAGKHFGLGENPNDFIGKVLEPLFCLRGSRMLEVFISRFCSTAVQKNALVQLCSVFDKAYEKLQSSYKNVKEGQIGLSEVKETTEFIDDNAISEELKLLWCYFEPDPDQKQQPNWIEERTEEIKIARAIDWLLVIAPLFLRIQTLYGLKGDFSRLSQISEDAVSNVKLAELKTHLRMSDYANFVGYSKEEIEALAAFADDDTKKFVSWLHQEAEKMHDFRTMINLASTLSYNDQDRERVQTLSSVVNGYEELIYNLEQSNGLDETVGWCEKLFARVREKPNLAGDLRRMASSWDWFKDLKERGNFKSSTGRELERMSCS